MVNARKITNAESGNPFMLMEGLYLSKIVKVNYDDRIRSVKILPIMISVTGNIIRISYLTI